MGIKLLVVDDHPLSRLGLVELIQRRMPNMMVVGEAENGVEAIRLTHELHPDVIIMDIQMPVMNGIEATRRIMSERPETGILVFSMELDKSFVEESLIAGARGYLCKLAVDFTEMETAICTVANNEIYLDSKISELIVKEYLLQFHNQSPSPSKLLTIREREIVQMIADGFNSKEIASKLEVSDKTIQVHRHNVMKKLNLNSVAALTKYALREGLTTSF